MALAGDDRAERHVVVAIRHGRSSGFPFLAPVAVPDVGDLAGSTGWGRRLVGHAAALAVNVTRLPQPGHVPARPITVAPDAAPTVGTNPTTDGHAGQWAT